MTTLKAEKLLPDGGRSAMAAAGAPCRTPRDFEKYRQMHATTKVGLTVPAKESTKLIRFKQ